MNEDRIKPLRIGDLEFDPARGSVHRDGEMITLSAEAGRLLGAFAASAGHKMPLAELSSSEGLSVDEVRRAAAEINRILGPGDQLTVGRTSLRLSGDNSVYRFLEELRNRKVFRVATGYAVTGWLLLQVAEIVFPLLGFGGPAMRALLLIIVLGFPVAIAAAWALELTPAGLVFDWRRVRPGREAVLDEVKLDRFIIAALVLVISVLILRIWTDTTDDSSAVRVVAVLPFASTSVEATDALLCEGFEEEIRVGLNRLPGIRVAPRDLQATVIDTGGTSDVGWLVEGNCDLLEERLKVAVSLKSADSGQQRWAYADARDLNELVVFQEDIATTLAFELGVPAEALQATIDAETANPRAYRFYLQGRGYLSRPHQGDSLATAAELFTRALAEDSAFAAANAGLCEANLARYLRSHETDLARQAESACLRASQLGPRLPEVRVALGRLFLETGDFVLAERALLIALELKPGGAAATRELANVLAAQNKPAQADSLYRTAIAVPAGSWRAHNDYGRFLLKQGRYEDAAIQFEEAVSLTPDNAPVHNNLGATYLQMGLIGEAATSFERVAEIEPVASSISNYGTILYYLGQFEASAGQFRKAAEMSPADHRMRGNIADAVHHLEDRADEAMSEYRKAAELAEQHLQISQKDAQALAALAWYRTRTGEHVAASELIDRALQLAPKDPEVIYYIALVELEIGNLKAALDFLALAVEAGYSSFLIEASPDLKALRGIPRFSELLGAG